MAKPVQKNAFTARVRAMCRARNLRPYELAQRLGISNQALHSLITSPNPSLETIRRIATGLGCEPGELVG